MWCPRAHCEYPAILHDGVQGRLASCGRCGFVFCCECNQAWHGLLPCANLAQRWRNGDEEVRASLTKKYGEKLLDELQSGEWIRSNTKPCIRCNTAIEKNGGCNHITCNKCGAEWCWLCSAKYEPGHFRNGSCEQFSDDFFEEIHMTREEFNQQYVVLNHN